jgi:hypothetical protein
MKLGSGFVAVSCLVFLVVSLSGCADQGPMGRRGGTGDTGSAGSVCMIFQDGVYPSSSYSSTEMVSIADLSPTNNLSGSSSYEAGFDGGLNVWRILAKFDVSSIIPTNVTVTDAYLTLYAYETASTVPTLEVHAMKTNWNEVSATWNSSDGSTPWGTSLYGGSFEATVIDTKTVTSAPKSVTFSIAPALVESWIADPTKNFGVIIESKYDGPPEGATFNIASFSKRSDPNAALRPKLTVYYTTIP